MSKTFFRDGPISGSYEVTYHTGELETREDGEHKYSKAVLDRDRIDYKGTFVIEIDETELSDMVRRAARNSSGRCKNGPVIVRARVTKNVTKLGRA